jgi:hypothetical protein
MVGSLQTPELPDPALFVKTLDILGDADGARTTRKVNAGHLQGNAFRKISLQCQHRVLCGEGCTNAADSKPRWCVRWFERASCLLSSRRQDGSVVLWSSMPNGSYAPYNRYVLLACKIGHCTLVQHNPTAATPPTIGVSYWHAK